jgi:hypothetical protein
MLWEFIVSVLSSYRYNQWILASSPSSVFILNFALLILAATGICWAVAIPA